MEPIGTVNPAKQVLIVDDERHVTYLMQHKMQKMGLDVLTARNGQEAMEKAVEVVPDLIITDFQMPVMSGIEMSLALRENPITQDVPIILVTGRGHMVPPSTLEKTSIRMQLAKPFSPRELISYACEVLGIEDQDAEAHAA